ncbi:MAG: hypothetical protein Q4E54_07900 [Lachnospiraceae bacterium]|nr:hypothetical protein [Lachnospiraceae bacterium]
MTAAIWGASQILNVPVITVYRFGIYGLGFYLGYFCLSHEAVMQRLSKRRIVLCAAAFAGPYILNRVIQEIPILRWCVLGISKKK